MCVPENEKTSESFFNLSNLYRHQKPVGEKKSCPISFLVTPHVVSAVYDTVAAIAPTSSCIFEEAYISCRVAYSVALVVRYVTAVCNLVLDCWSNITSNLNISALAFRNCTFCHFVLYCTVLYCTCMLYLEDERGIMVICGIFCSILSVYKNVCSWTGGVMFSSDFLSVVFETFSF